MFISTYIDVFYIFLFFCLASPPGTGKTLLAKAVANETSATFLRVVGSELIQKYLGDGPKLVRELFRVADEHAPSIVFIDEIVSIKWIVVFYYKLINQNCVTDLMLLLFICFVLFNLISI